MANTENLRVPSSAEARKIGAKGGKASGEARKKKKTIREISQAIAESKINLEALPPELKAKAELFGIDLADATVRDLIAIQAGSRAVLGDKDFYDRFVKAIGEEEAIVNDNMTVNISVEGADSSAGDKG